MAVNPMMAMNLGTVTAAERSMRSVFVGNIPYEATEEQLKDIFSEVGPVVSFRLVYDRETGKPKGYGFCEYKDQETALSAMRNLNSYELNGRPLRVDNAASEKSKEELKNLHAAMGGPPIESPYGTEIEPDRAPEAISKAVASLPPEQMFELMKQMKLCIQNNPNEARNMLLQNPQLAYALLQAQVIMRIVDPQVALGMLHRQNPNPTSMVPQTMENDSTLPGLGSSGHSMNDFLQFNETFHPPQNQNAQQRSGMNVPGRPALLGDRPPPINEVNQGLQQSPQQNQSMNPAGAPFQSRQAMDSFDALMENQQGDRDMRGLATHGDRDLRGPMMGLGDRDLRQQPNIGDQDLRHISPAQEFVDPRFRGVGVGSVQNSQGASALQNSGGPLQGSNQQNYPQGGRQQNPPGFDPRSGFDRSGAGINPTRPEDPRNQRAGNQQPPRNSGPQQAPVAPSIPVSAPIRQQTAGIAGITAQDQEKAALIMQVLQLSDQQIAMLPPEQRQSILVLKEQIARSAQH